MRRVLRITTARNKLRHMLRCLPVAAFIAAAMLIILYNLRRDEAVDELNISPVQSPGPYRNPIARNWQAAGRTVGPGGQSPNHPGHRSHGAVISGATLASLSSHGVGGEKAAASSSNGKLKAGSCQP